VVKVLIYIKMLFIFSTPMLIRHHWELKTIVFLHCYMWCSINDLFGSANYQLSTYKKRC